MKEPQHLVESPRIGERTRSGLTDLVPTPTRSSLYAIRGPVPASWSNSRPITTLAMLFRRAAQWSRFLVSSLSRLPCKCASRLQSTPCMRAIDLEPFHPSPMNLIPSSSQQLLLSFAFADSSDMDLTDLGPETARAKSHQQSLTCLVFATFFDALRVTCTQKGFHVIF